MTIEEAFFDVRVSTDMASLASVAGELSQVSDHLGLAYLRVEEQLAKIEVGVGAWVRMDDTYELGYGKTANKWGLLIKDGHSTEPAGTWRINEAPRKLRVRAAVHLSALLAELLETARSLHKEVTEATIKVNLFADALKYL